MLLKKAGRESPDRAKIIETNHYELTELIRHAKKKILLRSLGAVLQLFRVFV